MTNYSIEEIINIMQAKDYKVFDEGANNLNLVGIRNSEEPNANTFNDLFCCFYKDDSNNWQIHYWACTTDPGLAFRVKPMNAKFGTAILVPGQYRGTYQIGTHAAGSAFAHTALRQVKPVRLYRDRNLNEELDFDTSDIEEGLYGINIHRASAWNNAPEVNNWSAGCQVIQGVKNHEKLMELCKLAAEKYGDIFTYTLLESDDF
jgi:hypothetical protein